MEQTFAPLLELLNAVLTPENIWQGAVLIATYLGTDTQFVNAINFLKLTFNLSGKAVNFLVVVLAVVVSVAIMTVEGIITPEAFSVANFGALFVAVFYASQQRYQRLRQKELEGDIVAIDLKTIVLDRELTEANSQETLTN